MQRINKFNILLLLLLANFGAESQKKNSVIEEFIKGNDTLQFYVKKMHNDTATASFYQIYKDSNVYRVWHHYNNNFVKKKNRRELTKIAPDQLIYKKSLRYNFPISQVDTLLQIEDLIKSNNKCSTNNDLKFQFVLRYKKKYFVSKEKKCGKEILSKLFAISVGEAVPEYKDINIQ